jgi:hypothetical protein
MKPDHNPAEGNIPVSFLKNQSLLCTRTKRADLRIYYCRIPDFLQSCIGLVTAMQIKEAHGKKSGWCRKARGKETIFRFTLPGAGEDRTDKGNSG